MRVCLHLRESARSTRFWWKFLVEGAVRDSGTSVTTGRSVLGLRRWILSTPVRAHLYSPYSFSSLASLHHPTNAQLAGPSYRQ
jgi:hypothetical protein